jgi:uncharacterized protein
MRVSYVEIPVADLPRAVAFYQSVFDVDLELIDIDGNSMALFPETTAGANIALAMGDSYTPSKAGARVYIAVDVIDTVLARVIAHGGAELYPKTSVGEFGHVAEFEDSEGNCIALSSP